MISITDQYISNLYISISSQLFNVSWSRRASTYKIQNINKKIQIAVLNENEMLELKFGLYFETNCRSAVIQITRLPIFTNSVKGRKIPPSHKSTIILQSIPKEQVSCQQSLSTIKN